MIQILELKQRFKSENLSKDLYTQLKNSQI